MGLSSNDSGDATENRFSWGDELFEVKEPRENLVGLLVVVGLLVTGDCLHLLIARLAELLVFAAIVKDKLGDILLELILRVCFGFCDESCSFFTCSSSGMLSENSGFLAALATTGLLE